MRRGYQLAALAVLASVAIAPARLSAQTAEEVSAVSRDVPTWEVDGSHSRVGFSVRHFFTPVEGQFGDYEIELSFDPEAPETGHVRVAIDASSVDTGNDRRDNDLRGPSFFEVDAYPRLTFESTSVERISDTEFVVHGDLTIRDVTRPVDLAVTLLGMRELEGDVQREGQMIAGFEAEAVVDRRDFDVGSGRWAETVVLAPDVTIKVLLETRLH
ncbi:MAG: YceI family protein [Gemmatimonadales bacterium]|jgi:polyisoprenoid-binding protein YceI